MYALPVLRGGGTSPCRSAVPLTFTPLTAGVVVKNVFLLEGSSLKECDANACSSAIASVGIVPLIPVMSRCNDLRWARKPTALGNVPLRRVSRNERYLGHCGGEVKNREGGVARAVRVYMCCGYEMWVRLSNLLLHYSTRT